MARVVVDDHVLRDGACWAADSGLDGLAPDGIATSGLWLFRLCSSFADPRVSGRLTALVALLTEELQQSLRAQMIALPPDIAVLSMRDIAWPMAQLQARHRAGGRSLSAAMVEAVATAHDLDGALAVSRQDVGANLTGAAVADGIPFHIL